MISRLKLPAGAAANSLRSSLRANILEHIFIGELGRTLWCAGATDFEILRSEIDAKGHDLVVECGGVVRHIQLKSSHRGSSVRTVTINTALLSKPSGCVIWLEFDATMTLGPYRWFGAAPGLPLPALGDRIARHTRGRRDQQGVLGRLPRPGHRVLRITQFRTFQGIDQLVEAMFKSHAQAAT